MPATKLPKRNTPHKASIMQITEWKQRMMEELINDQQLCKLLKYNSEDALSRPDLTEDERYDLVGDRILPTRYTPNVQMEQQSMVGLSVGGFVPQESYHNWSFKYVMGYIYFYVLTDVKIMQTERGQRQDLILARIYDIFQDSEKYGMGHVQEGSLDELWEHNNKYGGYVLMMRVVDFK